MQKKGIHHLYIGKDRGLVKSVNFRKNKKPGITTMMVERAAEKREENLELWALFDLEIKLIGTSIFKPGMHLYLNPTIPGFGDPVDKSSLSRVLGLGGYYIVTSVTNDFVPNWETTITAKWTSYPISPSESTLVLNDPVQSDLRYDTIINTNIINSIGGGAMRGVNITKTKSTAPISTKPAGKGMPKPVNQQLQESANYYDGIDSATLTNLASGPEGFRSWLDQRYQQTQMSYADAENDFTYRITNAGAGGRQLFLNEFNTIQEAESVGLGMQKTAIVKSEGTVYGGKKADFLTYTKKYQDGSEKIIGGFFVYGKGETRADAEVFIEYKELSKAAERAKKE